MPSLFPTCHIPGTIEYPLAEGINVGLVRVLPSSVHSRKGGSHVLIGTCPLQRHTAH